MNTASEDRAATRLLAMRTPGKGLLALYLVLSLFAIFYLPYFFPVPPSTSDSYIFGYNNRVGIILLLVLVSFGAIWTKGLNFNFSSNGPSPKIPLKYLWLSLAIEFVVGAAMYLMAGKRASFGEPEYEVSRIWLLTQGKVPYRDFECNRGPFFLYPPKWLSDLFHLDVLRSYFVFWILVSLLGVLLLYATINLVDFPTARKTSIFFIFSGCAWLSVLNLGVNYALVRYFCPLYFILITYNVYRGNPRGSTQIRAGALALACTAVLALISPEITVAYVFACVVLLCPWRAGSRRIAAYSVMLAGLACLFGVAFKFGLFDDIPIDSQGANSFPIVLAPATLLFFAAVFVCACYMVQRLSRPVTRDNTVALLAFSLPMVAAALGRCDPGHIMLNGSGFLLAVFFFASAHPRAWKFYRNAFVVCFFVLSMLYGVFISIRLRNQIVPAFPKNFDLHTFYPAVPPPRPEQPLQAPFGYTPVATGLYFSPDIDLGFYVDNWNANTPDAIRNKVDELARAPKRSLLLPRGWPVLCKVDQTESGFISILFTFPYGARIVHPDSVRKPLCDYILDHYTLAAAGTPANFQYELWKPKP